MIVFCNVVSFQPIYSGGYEIIHPLSDNVLCFFVYFLSPMHFQIIHTFLPHYAQSSQISVLCMDKRGSKACQIHFKRLSSCSYHYMKLKTAMFSTFPS